MVNGTTAQIYGASIPPKKPQQLAETPSGGEGKNLLQPQNNGKKILKSRQVESMVMHLQNAPIYQIKYKKEENEVKELIELINKGMAEVTTT